MHIPHQIDEQIKPERAAIAQGLERIKNNTKKLEDKEYNSNSIYGILITDAFLALVVDMIKD